MTKPEDRGNHVREGTLAGGLRWIEVGARVYLEEDVHGAQVIIEDTFDNTQALIKGSSTRLSAGELAALARGLTRWFMDDPTTSILRIESMAQLVRGELEGWDARARADEEHPPYARLNEALTALLEECRSLREEGVFAREEEVP